MGTLIVLMTGQGQVVTATQDRYIRVRHLRNRTTTATTSAAQIPGLLRILDKTVRNRPMEAGIVLRRPVRCNDLTPRHLAERLLWCGEVERSLMVRWVVGSIVHGVDPLSYFSFQPVLHDWCNKGRGMCYPVCGMVHIKEPLLLIDKSSLCGDSGFPFSLSEWSLTICLTPYNRR